MEESILKTLETANLSKNESEIYMALLELGSASVSEIATKVNIHRVNIYDSLKRLMKKGLVSTIIKKEKKYFEPSSPEEIKEILKKKEQEIEKAKNAIPEMMELFETKKTKQTVHSYIGRKGIKTIYNNMLEQKGEHYAIGSTGVMREHFPIFVQQYTRKFKEKGIKWKTLYFEKAKGKQIYENVKAKYLPKNMTFMPMTIYLYNEWVAIISFEAMIGIEIQSKSMYQGFKKYFDYLWEISNI